jgi:hypothetical protein
MQNVQGTAGGEGQARMSEDDEVFTRQLRTKSFGPWPQLRKMLLREGVDPNTVRVRSIPDGGQGLGTDEGQLFEFRTRGVRFTARIKWRYPKGDASIGSWQREPR